MNFKPTISGSNNLGLQKIGLIKLNQNWVSNSWDIADVEFPVVVVGVQSHFYVKPNLGWVELWLSEGCDKILMVAENSQAYTYTVVWSIIFKNPISKEYISNTEVFIKLEDIMLFWFCYEIHCVIQITYQSCCLIKKEKNHIT